MKLIILLICIALQSFLKFPQQKERFYYFDHYFLSIKPLLTRFNLNGGVNTIIGVLLPGLLFIYILYLLLGHISLLYFIYATLVLLVCLNVHDMKSQLGDYFAAVTRQNMVQAQVQAENFIHHTVAQERAKMIRAVTEAILIRSLTDIFSVIFWFFLLGPFGATLYYLIAALAERAFNPNFELHSTYQRADYLKAILDWIPVRLVTLTYALTGHFGPVFNLWVLRLGAGLSDNRQFLVDCGLSSIQTDFNPTHTDLAENELALGLVVRTLWTWIIVIAIVKLFSWLMI